MQGQEVVSLDDEIVGISKMFHLVFAILVLTFEMGEHLWLGQSVHLVGCEGLVPENLVALSLLFGLSAFKHTVFVRPREHHLAALVDEASVFVSQSNLVLEHGVAATQELGVGNEALKLYLVENNHSFNILKEDRFYLVVAKQQFDEKRIEAEGIFNDSVLQQCAVVHTITAVHAQELFQLMIKVQCVHMF